MVVNQSARPLGTLAERLRDAHKKLARLREQRSRLDLKISELCRWIDWAELPPGGAKPKDGEPPL